MYVASLCFRVYLKPRVVDAKSYKVVLACAPLAPWLINGQIRRYD